MSITAQSNAGLHLRGHIIFLSGLARCSASLAGSSCLVFSAGSTQRQKPRELEGSLVLMFSPGRARADRMTTVGERLGGKAGMTAITVTRNLSTSS